MPLSVVIPTHNQAQDLQRHLPAILDQDYDDFEVIVVDMASTDETKDVLEHLELLYPNLRHSHTPATARDISLERLALTLGIRTARYEWVVITHPNCRPLTSQWLHTLSTQMKDGKDIIVGVAKYDEERQTWFDYKVGFFRLWHTLANLDHIREGHPAVRADGCNLAVRKSLFLNKDAFSNHLNLLTGAEELLVNHLSNSHNTAVVTTKDAMVIEDHLPSKRLWKKQRVFYMETRRHQQNASLYRAKQNLRLLFPWLVFITLCALWPVLACFYPQEEIAISLITGLVIMVLTGVWIRNCNRAAYAIGYEHRYVLTRLLFTLALPLWNFSAWLTYLFSPKTEFCKKFV